AATDDLLLVVAVGVHERRGDAVRVLLHGDALRVPLDPAAVRLARVVADIVLRVVLPVHEQVRVTAVDRREVEAGAYLAAPARRIDEMQDVALVVDAVREEAADEPFVDSLEDLERAGVHGDCARGRRRAGQAIHRPRRDSAPRELEREHRARRTAADDQNRHFAPSHPPELEDGPLTGQARPMTSLHNFSAVDIDGREQPLARYAGRVALVVNVASRCGFTPQYAGLESLWRRYRDRGLVVLGFPCDQFGRQEPGDEAEIKAFCSATYDVTFPLFAKISVNGPDA